MRIGINEGRTLDDVEGLVARARDARDAGLHTFWVPQIGLADALTALAVVGREVDGIELGTAVVPVHPRHPSVLAAQALTVQAATGNRLALGIGLSHKFVVEGAWGYSYDRPVQYLDEYLDALLPMLRGEMVDVRGERVTAIGQVTVAGATPPQVLVAALGPRMLALTGRRADGTITWCTGRRTLAEHIVPTLREAAEAAGRPAPRVVAGLPVCVTHDVAATRERVATFLAGYGTLPSYRAMLDREGVEGPEDIAVLGDEDAVAEQLAAIADAGVTDLSAAIIATSRADAERTTELLRRLATA